jgi:hypothetical protein
MSMWVFVIVAFGAVAVFLAARCLRNWLVKLAYKWLDEKD